MKATQEDRRNVIPILGNGKVGSPERSHSIPSEAEGLALTQQQTANIKHKVLRLRFPALEKTRGSLLRSGCHGV
jgi:hypothetical protein